MVLTVHHLDNSRSQRVLWLLVRQVLFPVLQFLDVLNPGRASSSIRDQTIPERCRVFRPEGTEGRPRNWHVPNLNGGRLCPR